MEGKEPVPRDLTPWMARISGQLKQSVIKKDIELLATKTDIDLINDRITAQAQEISTKRKKTERAWTMVRLRN